ncbi:hypothetical protein DPEC_G00148660 [Dallia pectoralis]|uniref:Uncharacterized protein n=1 Tax=Dallia pectoralis TaxID=75939 RepID=A0ACC2GIZ2_DALPE|nr:hypothetical protein DPEC_G00148660 [Dallia pectoralis]
MRSGVASSWPPTDPHQNTLYSVDQQNVSRDQPEPKPSTGIVNADNRFLSEGTLSLIPVSVRIAVTIPLSTKATVDNIGPRRYYGLIPEAQGAVRVTGSVREESANVRAGDKSGKQ